jgi:hypothetical protein
MFPKALTLAACGAAVLATGSHAATIAYDGFETPGDYTNDATINGVNGGENFTSAWAGQTSYLASSSSLTYGSLVTTDGSLDRDSTGFGGIQRSFASTDTDGSIFFSYLFTNQDNTNASDAIVFRDSAGNTRFRVGFNNFEAINIQTQLAGGDGSNYIIDTTANDLTELQNGSTVLIVGQLDIGLSSDDVFTVWINPTDLSDVSGTAKYTLSASEQDVRDLQTTSSTGSFAPINTLRLELTGGTDQDYVFDEFRVAYGSGASIGDVVPVPEPGSLALVMLGGLAMLGRRRTSA